MLLTDIIKAIKVDEVVGTTACEIADIHIDSRRVAQGHLFVALRGTQVDGHQYIQAAIDKGAVAIVCEQLPDMLSEGVTYVRVPSSEEAVGPLATAFNGNPTDKVRLVGVTGTNGKTTIATLLYNMFRAMGYKVGLVSTVCNYIDDEAIPTEHTTPDAITLNALLGRMADEGCKYVFMEVSSHALALSKVDAISFDTVLFTNLTRDHLDFHGTMEAYFSAKKRLLSLGRRAVINGDDPQIATLGREGRTEVLTCSVREGDYLAYEIEHLGMEGSDLRIRSPKGDFSLRMRIPGDFSVMNGLMAAAVALEKGISHRVIREVFAHSCGVPGRMERVPARGGPRILIDYAHTPDALEKLLMTVRQLRRPEERIFLLFGCGGERDRGKRKEMGRIATRFADLVIVTSDNSRGEDPERILSDILRGIDKEREYVLIPDRREAIGWAVKTARQRDWVLLAGKGHETYEIDGTGRHPFDERVIVKQALEERNAPSAGQ